MIAHGEEITRLQAVLEEIEIPPDEEAPPFPPEIDVAIESLKILYRSFRREVRTRSKTNKDGYSESATDESFSQTNLIRKLMPAEDALLAACCDRLREFVLQTGDYARVNTSVCQASSRSCSGSCEESSGEA